MRRLGSILLAKAVVCGRVTSRPDRYGCVGRLLHSVADGTLALVRLRWFCVLHRTALSCRAVRANVGYRVDSALSPPNLRELTRSLRFPDRWCDSARYLMFLVGPFDRALPAAAADTRFADSEMSAFADNPVALRFCRPRRRTGCRRDFRVVGTGPTGSTAL